MRTCAWVLCFLLASGTARAAEVPEADRLLLEGTRLFTEEFSYEDALEAFEQSYKLIPSWKALNGIALVHQQQGQVLRALETYERLMAEFRATLSPKQTTTVEHRIAELGRRVGVLELEVTQDGAEVAINGIKVARGPYRGSTRVLPGPHAVLAILDKHQPFTRTVVVGAGEHASMRIALEPERVKVIVQTRPQRLVRRFPTWLPWSSLAAGAGLGAVGALFSWRAAANFDEFDRRVRAQAGPVPTPAQVDESPRRAGETQRGIATGLYIGGAALATAGLVLMLLNQPRVEAEEPPAPSLRLVPTGAGVSLLGSF